jgi:Xaa-Pro dipeptidase
MMLFNRSRANRLLKEAGLDAVIATTPENVTYVAGYISQFMHIGRGAEIYAVFPAEPVQPVLVLPSYDMPILAQEGCWIEDLRSYGASYFSIEDGLKVEGSEAILLRLLNERPMAADALSALVAALADRNLSSGRIAIDEGSVGFTTFQRLRAALPDVEFVAGSGLLRQIRAVKTEEELKRLRRATAINQEGLRAVLERIRPGVSEYDLYQTYRETVTGLGATPKLWACGFGSRGAALFRPSKEVYVQPGASVRLDTGCTVDGYWSDIGRSGIVGKPLPEHQRYYEAIYAGVEAALYETKPGVRASHLFEVAMEAVRSHGLRHYARHHCGHGLGVEETEIPMIAPPKDGFDPLLEPDMVICYECPYYLLGFGGVQFEETLCVTSTGYELLTSLDRHLLQF